MVKLPSAILISELVMKSDEKEKKYKYTKQLLRIAIENGGYTNEDIVIKAGLKPSSVASASKWRNGKSDATERQLQYFINEYEHLLKRKLEHLFYGETSNTSEERGVEFKKLVGEVILKHQVRVPSRRHRDKTVSVLRIVIIQHNLKFHVIKQYRAGLLHINGSCDENAIYRSDCEEANWFFYETDTDLCTEDMEKSFYDFNNSLLSGENPTKNKFNNQVTSPLEFIFIQKKMKLGLY